MTMVVDASVFMCIILNEPEKQKIIALTEGVDVSVPNTLSFKMCNAFTGCIKEKN